MGWCSYCVQYRETERDLSTGFLWCCSCGKVIDQDTFSTELTFTKSSGGQSQMSGHFVKSVLNEHSVSHERTLMKGRDEISDMVVSLGVGGGNSIIDSAFAFYKIAVEKNFTRGRRTSQVAAACLYIACREKKKAYLLIDFSDYLQINVYVLGAVFLQLCKMLRLDEHPIVQKPVDPSLFIHRFTERLLQGKNSGVSRTALHIIASMKRDWMQTGRKPSGLCGAALYISALSHGLRYSKSDIIEEFNTKAEELEKEPYSRQPNVGSGMSGTMELLCEHKDHGYAHFAHGLCADCYKDFVELSGGLQGGSEPPSFQRAQRERLAKASSAEDKESSLGTTPYDNDNGNTQFEKEVEPLSNGNPDVIKCDKMDSGESANIGADTGNQVSNEGASDPSHGYNDMDNMAGDESESLSDIDDVEVDGYLHNEEEKRYKKIIWEEMNREYLEEQAAKEAAAAAAKEAYEANFQNCSEELLAAQQLAAAAAAAVAKSRKERQQKRAADAKNATPAQTAAEATRQMLTKKRLSSKINYDVLDKLFDDSTASEKTKRKHIESDAENEANEQQISKKSGKKELESDVMDNEDDLGQENEYEEGYGRGDYGDELYYGNEEEGYGFDEDYGYDED